VDLIIIDYLQLIDSEVRGGSTNDKVAKISREISILASSSYMNCPVIPLSQLNRNVESRADKRPTLSDLRDSGSLEQDATGVIFIYRPSVYDPESIEDNELIMAKNRHGGLATDYFDFKYPFTRFTKTSSAVIEQPVYDNVDFKQFRKTVTNDQIDF
jgi:replicative DNA helicase